MSFSGFFFGNTKCISHPHSLFQLLLSLHDCRAAGSSFQFGLSLAIMGCEQDMEAPIGLSEVSDFSRHVETEISLQSVCKLHTDVSCYIFCQLIHAVCGYLSMEILCSGLNMLLDWIDLTFANVTGLVLLECYQSVDHYKSSMVCCLSFVIVPLPVLWCYQPSKPTY